MKHTASALASTSAIMRINVSSISIGQWLSNNVSLGCLGKPFTVAVGSQSRSPNDSQLQCAPSGHGGTIVPITQVTSAFLVA